MSDYQRITIIWVDENIGRPEHCQLLKKAFAKIFVQEWNCATFLGEDTIETLIRNDFSCAQYFYKTTAIDLYVFSNEEDCMGCIEEHRGTRIFFIFSLPFAKRILPQIINSYSDVLQESHNYRLRSVYIFHANPSTADGIWYMRYAQYILIIRCETDLVKTLINDIARYFMTVGQKQYDCRTPAAIRQSLEYYDWAHIMLGRVFESGDAWQCKETLCDLQTQITQSETALQKSMITELDQYRHNNTDKTNDTRNPQVCEAIPPTKTSSSVFGTLITGQYNRPVKKNTASIASVHRKDKTSVQTRNSMDDEPYYAAITVYLQEPVISTEKFKRFRLLLEEFLSAHLIVSSNIPDNFQGFKGDDSVIVVHTLSSDDDEQALEEMCSLGVSTAVYVLGIEPYTTSAKRKFFDRYLGVCAVLEDPKELAIKLIVDVALKSRVMGDRYARSNDKERAEIMYDQCIGLLKQLNTFAAQFQ